MAELMHRLSRQSVMLVAGALGAVLLLLAGFLAWGRGQAKGLDDYGAAPPFTLTDQLERSVDSRDLAGKVVVASFVYTHCPDICPVLSRRMQTLQERLRGERLLGERVQLLSFTVDPARDTPPVLRVYAEAHQADPDAWRFLSGPADEILPLIVEGFHLGVQALPPQTVGHDGDGAGETSAGYDVTHSGRFVLIDRTGRIRAYYNGTDVYLGQVVSDIRSLLR